MLTSSGLLSAWNSNFQKNYAHKPKSNDEIEPKRLSFDQVSGLMIICTISYAISVGIFILEVMSTGSRSIKILLDYFASDRTVASSASAIR